MTERSLDEIVDSRTECTVLYRDEESAILFGRTKSGRQGFELMYRAPNKLRSITFDDARSDPTAFATITSSVLRTAEKDGAFSRESLVNAIASITTEN